MTHSGANLESWKNSQIIWKRGKFWRKANFDAGLISIQSYGKDENLIDGLIYMQRLSEPTKVSSCTRQARMFRKLCGDQSMSSITIATTFWGMVSEEAGEARVRDLKDQHLGPYIARGAQLKKYDDNKESAHQIISDILKAGNALPVRIQKQAVSTGNHLVDASGFEESRRIFRAQVKEFSEKMTDWQQGRRGKSDIYLPCVCFQPYVIEAEPMGDFEVVAQLQRALEENQALETALETAETTAFNARRAAESSSQRG